MLHPVQRINEIPQAMSYPLAISLLHNVHWISSGKFHDKMFIFMGLKKMEKSSILLWLGSVHDRDKRSSFNKRIRTSVNLYAGIRPWWTEREQGRQRCPIAL